MPSAPNVIGVRWRSSAVSVLARRFTFAQAALALVIALFLLVFLVIPVFTVIYVAFTSNGSFTLQHFQSFFHLTLMRKIRLSHPKCATRR